MATEPANATANEPKDGGELPGPRDEIERSGPYRILSEVARSDFASVYRAEEVLAGRLVAIKVFHPRGPVPAIKELFLREARIQAAILNPHVVPVYRVGEVFGEPFVVMPFLDGCTLGHYLLAHDWVHKAADLRVVEAVQFAHGIADGLAELHAKGFIHHNIQPRNIWVEPNGNVRLLGFTLSAKPDEVVGEGAGTPLYISPEQEMGTALDSRTDLFSLGVVLYELATGDRPAHAARTVTPPAPQALVSNLPSDLDSLIQQLLEKDRARRPSSAREVVERLAQIERELIVLRKTALAAENCDRLTREIVEFEKQCSPPDQNAIFADARWFQDHWGKPELTQYRGSFVAVLNGAVVGHGPDALRLQLETAKKFNVHPERFILEYIPRPTL
jgi:serine/threonine protein kinase